MIQFTNDELQILWTIINISGTPLFDKTMDEFGYSNVVKLLEKDRNGHNIWSKLNMVIDSRGMHDKVRTGRKLDDSREDRSDKIPKTIVGLDEIYKELINIKELLGIVEQED